MKSPFGARPIFRGEVLVSGSVVLKSGIIFPFFLNLGFRDGG